MKCILLFFKKNASLLLCSPNAIDDVETKEENATVHKMSLFFAEYGHVLSIKKQ